MSSATKEPTKSHRKRLERTWLACFQFDEPGLPGTIRPHGYFQIVVKAATPDRALVLCRCRMRELRDTTTLFQRPSTIYLNHIIAITDTGEKPVLVNYSQSVHYGEGDYGEILCGLPEQPDLMVDVFGPPDHEGEAAPVFLDFGGQHANELIEQMTQRRATRTPVTPPARGRRRGPR